MRRGMILVDNSLELIVVGIAVVLIFAGGAFAYNTLKNKNEEKNAQHLLDSVLAKYDALEDGQNNSFIFQGFRGGEKWYLTGWTARDPTRPEKCFFTSCLCVCKGGANADSCQNKGFCRSIETDSVDVSTTLKVNQQSLSGGMTISSSYQSFQCIILSKLVLTFDFKKAETSLVIWGNPGPTSIEPYYLCARR